MTKNTESIIKCRNFKIFDKKGLNKETDLSSC